MRSDYKKKSVGFNAVLIDGIDFPFGELGLAPAEHRHVAPEQA